MNGRMYDPVVGRMLSTDNFVQSPDNTQNYNRYSYALNNPLKYSDPDGEWIHLVIGAVIGGTMNWIMNGADFSWKGLGHFGVGALAAGIGGGVNVALAKGSFSAGFLGTATGISSTGFIAGAATGASAGLVNGLVTGTGNGLMQGNSLGQSLGYGVEQGLKQSLSGGITGGIFAGIDASLKGKDFFTGDAIQYKGTQALYASLDGGSDVYTDIDDYSVFNQSGKDIYYKPEDGAYGLSNKIKSGYGIKNNVDGIATSKYSDCVYKIPGKLGASPNAIVNRGGDVNLSFSAIDKIALKIKLSSNPSYHYGWSSYSQLDKTWKTLFDLAKILGGTK